MFPEIIEVPPLRPGPAQRKRRMTNLLSRIKVEMFGAESLKPEFLIGKDVRALNKQLVEAFVCRLLSKRDGLIETVYRDEKDQQLDFYIALNQHDHEAQISVWHLVGEYEMLEISERYPIMFFFISKEKRAYAEKKGRTVYIRRGAKACASGKA